MNKIEKPVKEICGYPAFTPVIGNRAFVCCDNGDTIWTSLVVGVRNITDSGIEIETKNTIYKLTYTENELPKAV